MGVRFQTLGALCFALCVSGCKEEAPRPQRSTTAQTTTRHANPRRAVDRCASAVERHRRQSPELVTAVCAHLFVEEQCQSSIQRIYDVPLARRPRVVASACRLAYCELFAEPKPVLCEVNLSTARMEEIVEHWQEFISQVYRLDLGAHQAERALEVFQPFPRSEARERREVSADPPLRAAVFDTGSGVDVWLTEPDGEVHRASYVRAPRRTEIAPLFERVQDLPRSTPVAITVSRGGDASIATEVHQAARSAGFLEVAIEIN